ncbi:7SK snRNA methylphosphate capping enzyme [Chanos chanos]|uniref:RNA methyltransferase n=1 Tax=Chanos chanos TaxID=29144 RepID=A0A6J2WWV8_CHACN|nr:7SK snRNA methylphosphate capping enzyme-like [Chanos chanos]
MLEMSVDKEAVELGESPFENTAVHPSHLHSKLSGNDTNVPEKPEIMSKNPHNEDDTSINCPPVVPVEKSNNMSNTTEQDARDSSTMGAESSLPLESKNGLQLPKPHPPPCQPHQQRFNKRRSNTINASFKHPIFGKRRRRSNSETESVLPTNFLLGGNIFDPLNLNSLLDEEVNRALNAETPKSSPLPAKSRDPVEILIPRDITDPLNLNCCSTGDGGRLISPLKAGGRRRHRNRHHGGGGGIGGGVKADAEGALTRSDVVESDQRKPSEGGDVSQQTEQRGASLSGIKASALDRSSEEMKNRPAPLHSVPMAQAQCANNPPLFPSAGGQDEEEERRPREPVVVASETSTAPVSSSTRTNAPHSLTYRQRKRKHVNAGQPFEPAAKRGPSGRGRGAPHTPQTGANSVPVGGRGRRQKKTFQYGNYNKYYGYRNPGACEDPRVRVLKPEWFRGKSVLDLGCNTGHLTLTIAKNWRPARIVGLDIDGELVHAARQNIRHYLSELQTQEARHCGGEEEAEKERAGVEGNERRKNGRSGVEEEQKAEEKETVKQDAESDKKRDGESHNLSFPVSLRISRGPIAAPPLPNTPSPPPGNFPANVFFVKGNYVLESDLLLATQKEEYDVILCLSVSKWVHLNWGDAGLRRLFQRVYRHLRPGGLFILEPQPWTSYSKRKRLTDAIYKNYCSIRFKPEQFPSYLTSEVGFSSYELIGTPKSSSQGFQRPIYVFHKRPSSQN